VRKFELINLNTYWMGLSFMWNSLHVLVLPAILLGFVPDERKNTVLGLMTFCGLIVAMIVQPLAGAWSDRLQTRFGRRRPWIAFGTLFDLLFLSLMAVAGGLPLLTVAYVGLQFTSNLAHGPAQGLMRLIISSLLMGRILSGDSLVLPLGVIAGFLLFSATFTVFGVGEVTADEVADESADQDPAGAHSQVSFRTHRNYWRLIVARLVFLTGVYGVQAFVQYFIRDTLVVDDPVKLTGDLLATIALTLIGFTVFAGYLSDRLGRKPLHTAAVALIVVGNLLMTTADTASDILLFGCVIGSGIGLFLSANWALANDLAPSGEAGKFLGLTNLATAGASALSRLAGPGIDALNNLSPGLGYTGLFVAAAVFGMLSLLILIRIPEGGTRVQPAL
jgi:MFS family permease